MAKSKRICPIETDECRHLTFKNCVIIYGIRLWQWIYAHFNPIYPNGVLDNEYIYINSHSSIYYLPKLYNALIIDTNGLFLLYIKSWFAYKLLI